MRELAVSRGGRCLSERYVNAWSKLRWRCADGHEWESAPANVKSGSWCHKCGRIVTSKKLRLSLKHLHSAAKRRGGMCLSEKYERADTKYLWRCAKNHEWLPLSRMSRREPGVLTALEGTKILRICANSQKIAVVIASQRSFAGCGASYDGDAH